jgi:hypothetical protein
MAVENEAGESNDSSPTPLDQLFGNDPEPAEKSASVEVSEEKGKEKEEASQKLPEGTTSPEAKAKEVEPLEEKEVDETPTAKSESKSTEKEVPTPEQKAAKEAEEAKKKWENEENPYFKRFKDTSTNWQREHQEKLQLQQQVQQLTQDVTVMKKIADGTYDPEKDDPARSVTPEAIATQALNVGKALASRSAMVESHGEDVVQQKLDSFHERFGNNPMIQQLVLDSKSPVQEAFRILDRLDFETKYGSTPVDWHKNIRAEAEKELRDKIKAEVTEELMGRADKKKNTPRGLSSARGSNGLKTDQNSKGSGPTSLKEIFS